MEEEYSQYSEDTTQMEDTQNSTQMSQDEVDRFNVQNMVSKTSVKPHPTLSFTTDKGCYQWLGCSVHKINLVIKEAFRKNKTAAHLLKKCKKKYFFFH